MPKESAYFLVNSIDNKQQIKKIKKDIDTLPGVLSVSVNEQNGRIAVDYDNTGATRRQIKNKINDLGFEISEELNEKNY